jgi:hypothetical protein
MVFIIIFCSYLNFIKWLQNNLISCPFKKITGIDCPGCGFQRSVIALLKGNWRESFHLYPATIPLLITTLFLLSDMVLHFKHQQIIKKTLYIVTGNIIVIGYLFKIHSSSLY